MNRTVWILIIVQLVDAIGLGLLLPVLPYFVQEYGASPVEVTQLVALFALVSMLCSPVVGRLSDRLGRKPIVLLSAIGTSLAYLAYLEAESLAAIFLIRGFTGLLAAKGGVVSAWLIDVIESDQRSRYLGLLGSMNGIGMLLGPLLASVLVAIGADHYTLVFIAGSVLSVVATLGVLSLKDRPRGEPSPAAPSAINTESLEPPYFDLLFLNFAVFLAFSVVFSTSAIYMQHQFSWDVKTSALAIGIMTGTVALARAVFAHRVLNRLGNSLGTWSTGAVMAAALMLAGAVQDPLIFMFFYCLSASAYAVAGIGVTVLLADRVPPATRGLSMGRLSAASSAAIVVGAATHGYLFELYNPSVPFLLYGTLVLIFVTAWFTYDQRHRRYAHE